MMKTVMCRTPGHGKIENHQLKMKICEPGGECAGEGMMMRGIRFITLILAGCLLLEPYKLHGSNFADTYGFSATGISMGNAVTSLVDDWSSVYYNIAGLGKTRHLAFREGTGKIDTMKVYKTIAGKKLTERDRQGKEEYYSGQIAVTYLHTYPMLKINISRSTTTGTPLKTPGDQNLDFGAVILGIAFDINKIIEMPEFISSARFGLGLGSLSDGSASKVNDVDLQTHNFMRYGREAQKAVIIAGIGLGFLDDLFGVGVGSSISFHGSGAVKVTGVEVGPSSQTPPAQSKMDLKSAPSLVAGIYFNPGKAVSALEGLNIGAAYRQESYMEIDPFATDTELKIGSTQMSMNMSIFEYYTPHIFVGGVSYTFEGFTVSADCEYQMWSRFRVSSAMQFVFDRLAAEYGEQYRIKKFKDIIVPKIGLSYQPVYWLKFMAGYYYQPSFIPDEAVKGKFNFLDNEKHVGSLGIKFFIPRLSGTGGPLEITMGFQGQYMVERTVTKDNPESINPNYTYGGWNPTGIFELTMRL